MRKFVHVLRMREDDRSPSGRLLDVAAAARKDGVAAPCPSRKDTNYVAFPLNCSANYCFNYKAKGLALFATRACRLGRFFNYLLLSKKMSIPGKILIYDFFQWVYEYYISVCKGSGSPENTTVVPATTEGIYIHTIAKKQSISF